MGRIIGIDGKGNYIYESDILKSMSTKEAAKIGIQLGVLRELLPQYSHRTLDNIIQGLEARLAEYGITHEATLVGFPELDKPDMDTAYDPMGVDWLREMKNPNSNALPY